MRKQIILFWVCVFFVIGAAFSGAYCQELQSKMLLGMGAQLRKSITFFQWRKIQGGYCTIVSPLKASTVVKNLQAGVYKFEFKITFASGNVARDTVQVTVRRRPHH